MSEGSFVNEFVAGCFGGFAQVIIGQPFDIVKVRLQSAPDGVKLSAVEVAKNILKNEGGALAFWKGSLPPLAGVGAAVSIQFGVNENTKKLIRSYTGKEQLTIPQNVLCGLLAGVANCLIAVPAEHLRIRIQAQSATNPIYNGPIDCFKKITSQHGYGVDGLFKGSLITVLREGVAYGVYFSVYAYLMEKLIRPGQSKKDLPLYKIGGAGALAGMALWISSYPLDIIKTKIQTDSFTEPRYKGISDCSSQIMKSYGVAGFFKGFLPCIVRSVPVNAGTFVVYETIYNTLSKKH